jgi:hypothetical protein
MYLQGCHIKGSPVVFMNPYALNLQPGDGCANVEMC